MENAISYRYEALNEESYDEMLGYVLAEDFEVALYPESQTIVIANFDEAEVGKFIDDNALDFRIKALDVYDNDLDSLIDSETVDANTLRKVAERLRHRIKVMAEANEKSHNALKEELFRTRNEHERLSGFLNEANCKSCRVRKQVEAIAVMLDSIFPKG